MLIAFLLFILSLGLKCASLASRAAFNVALAAGGEQSPSGVLRSARAGVWKLLRFFSRIVDALNALIVASWLTFVAAVMAALLAVNTSVFLLTQDPEVLKQLGSTSAGVKSGQKGGNQGGEYSSGQGVPAVAASPNQIGLAIVANAKWASSQKNYTYDWGARGPNGYDCSGWVSALLLMSGWTMDGSGKAVQLPADQDRVIVGKSSADQVTSKLSASSGTFRAVSRPFNGDVNSLKPGDIISGPGHVGVYIGDGWISHASTQGAHVKKGPSADSEDISDVGFQQGYLTQWVTHYLRFE